MCSLPNVFVGRKRCKRAALNNREQRTLFFSFFVVMKKGKYISILWGRSAYYSDKILTTPACFFLLLIRANIRSTISKDTMKVRLPTSLNGKNVHTTRNITESLPAESASQDDTLISTCKEHMTLPSNAAVPYEDYVDDGSMTTCTNMFAENRTRKVQIYTKNCADSDSDIDSKGSFSSKDHVAQYLINYISRQKTYSEIRRNCQTFAADFCAFLAGKKDVEPYHPINRIQYHNQTYYFLYEPSMYQSHH